MSCLGFLLALGACGRVGFADRVAIDGSSDPDAANRCAAELVDLGPFGPPTLISTASSVTSIEDDPEPSDDGLELFFISDRAGGLGSADVWKLSRATPQDSWGAPVHVAALSTASYENTLDLSADALTMWLVSARAGGSGMDDLWVATRPSRAGAWTTPSNVAELNSPLLDRGPSVWGDDLQMWFHSSRTGPQQFYATSRSARTDAWSAPQRIAAPSGIRPWISPCGLELYYQSGTGTNPDLFVARRGSTGEDFGPGRRLDELSSAFYDQDLRLSPDRRHAYFSSERGDGVDAELYEASR